MTRRLESASVFPRRLSQMHVHAASARFSRRVHDVCATAALTCALVFLGACGEHVEKPAARKADGTVALADPSLKFMTIETIGETKLSSGAVLPGRLAMRP